MFNQSCNTRWELCDIQLEADISATALSGLKLPSNDYHKEVKPNNRGAEVSCRLGMKVAHCGLARRVDLNFPKPNLLWDWKDCVPVEAD